MQGACCTRLWNNKLFQLQRQEL
ncbi:unnamed protein product [Rhodiola kirilowii]